MENLAQLYSISFDLEKGNLVNDSGKQATGGWNSNQDSHFNQLI